MSAPGVVFESSNITAISPLRVVDINAGCFSQEMLPFEVQIVSHLMKSSVEVSSGAPW